LSRAILLHAASAQSNWLQLPQQTLGSWWRLGPPRKDASLEGPRRKEHESFADFRERWSAFYAAQIENNFRGPSCNISLRTFWPNLIRAHAEKAGSGAGD